jgi:hypothetical protein
MCLKLLYYTLIVCLSNNSYLFLFNYPFINPIVNPADILHVNGIPKLVIDNEDAVAV